MAGFGDWGGVGGWQDWLGMKGGNLAPALFLCSSAMGPCPREVTRLFSPPRAAGCCQLLISGVRGGGEGAGHHGALVAWQLWKGRTDSLGEEVKSLPGRS